MITSVEEYIMLLKKELKGCDRACIQDALSNSEEHLHTAMKKRMEEEPESDSNEVLTEVIDEFGDPAEVAGEYRKMEQEWRPMFPSVEAKDSIPFWKKFLNIIGDVRAWSACLYMLISIVTGIIYGTWIMVLLPVTLSLLIFIIGIPLAGLFMLSLRGAALIEGRIVEALLGTRMPRKPIFMKGDRSWWAKFKALVSQGVTWKAMAYMLLHMALGIIYFTLIISLFSTALACIAAPVVELITHNSVEYNSDNLPGWVIPLLPILGALILLGTLHLAKFIGKWHGKYAKIMLVRR